MLRYLLLILLCASPVYAQRVSPPQDANKLYVLACGQSTDANYVKLCHELTLAKGFHVACVPTHEARFSELYANDTPVLPSLKVMRADGTVLYTCHGKALLKLITHPRLLLKKIFGCKKPDQKKEQTEDESQSDEEDTLPEPEPKKFPTTAYVLTCLASLALSLRTGWHQLL